MPETVETFPVDSWHKANSIGSLTNAATININKKEEGRMNELIYSVADNADNVYFDAPYLTT